MTHAGGEQWAACGRMLKGAEEVVVGAGGGRVRCEEAGREQDDDGRTESR